MRNRPLLWNAAATGNEGHLSASFETVLTTIFHESGDAVSTTNFADRGFAVNSLKQSESGSHPWAINFNYPIEIELSALSSPCFLWIVAEPVRAPAFGDSFIRVTFNDAIVGVAQTWGKRVRLAIPFPPPATDGRPSKYTVKLEEFRHRDKPSYRLAEVRLIVCTVAPTTRPARRLPEISDPADLLSQFESLGDNCEFGIVQRNSGIDPLGLFRFSSIWHNELLDGLESNFEALNDPALLELRPHIPNPDGERELLSHQTAFGMISHTHRYVGHDDFQSVWQAEFNKLKFLRSKLIEDMEDGEKIFIRKANYSITIEEILPIWIALQKYGANRLLWLVQGDKDHIAGQVEWLAPGLIKGYVERFAPYDNVAFGASTESWITVCRNALSLVSVDL